MVGISGATTSISDFGAVLRDWRNHRRLSQLALSGESGISQRHISFLETGRSQPSRATVLALSDSLDIPLRERNVLFHSAGYSAAYSKQPLDDESTRVFRDALQATLENHEPFSGTGPGRSLEYADGQRQCAGDDAGAKL